MTSQTLSSHFPQSGHRAKPGECRHSLIAQLFRWRCQSLAKFFVGRSRPSSSLIWSETRRIFASCRRDAPELGSSCFGCQGAFDRLFDPPHCIVLSFAPLFRVEALDSFGQSNVTLGDQVQQRQTKIGVIPRDVTTSRKFALIIRSRAAASPFLIFPASSISSCGVKKRTARSLVSISSIQIGFTHGGKLLAPASRSLLRKRGFFAAT